VGALASKARHLQRADCRYNICLSAICFTLDATPYPTRDTNSSDRWQSKGARTFLLMPMPMRRRSVSDAGTTSRLRSSSPPAGDSSPNPQRPTLVPTRRCTELEEAQRTRQDDHLRPEVACVFYKEIRRDTSRMRIENCWFLNPNNSPYRLSFTTFRVADYVNGAQSCLFCLCLLFYPKSMILAGCKPRDED
jgi:hypothetical protein